MHQYKDTTAFSMDAHSSIVKEKQASWWVFKAGDLMGGVGLAGGEADESQQSQA
jgi:hypothetical protein